MNPSNGDSVDLAINDPVAQWIHQMVILVLSGSIKWWSWYSADPSNGDPGTQWSIKWWSWYSVDPSNGDPVAQWIHQMVILVLSGSIKWWSWYSVDPSNGDPVAQWIHQMVILVLSGSIKWWSWYSVDPSNGDPGTQWIYLIMIQCNGDPVNMTIWSNSNLWWSSDCSQYWLISGDPRVAVKLTHTYNCCDDSNKAIWILIPASVDPRVASSLYFSHDSDSLFLACLAAWLVVW